MIENIKITGLTNIGANLSYTAIFPVVNVTGTPITNKANLQIIGNYILSQAGGANMVQAAQATLAQAVVNSAQPNITSVGTLTSLAVTGNITGGNLLGLYANGNSNINIPAVNGNVNISAVGNANILVVTGTGANITGTANVSGNANVGNLGAAQVIATANITAPQLISNIATGTAPLVVTSTTQVANLSVATAGSATTAGTVTTNAQPNITSVGTLTALAVTGNANFTGSNISLGSNANVKITGGLTGQYVRTDGAGNLSFSTVGDADNVLYVSKSGNDSNDGKTLNSAKLTIKAAVAIATPGTNIFVKAGDYTEQNPISLATRVTIVGDNLRAVTIRPANPTQDIFWVRPGCYITGVTFRDHLEPSAAVAFPPTGAGFVSTSPYVQNCSSITTTGCGMRINGNYASGLKSMVVDSFTQFNQGGKGIHILNSGYAQLVSVFTICTTIGVHCESGGQCSISNSNNSFGDYALVSDGHSPELYSGVVDNFINGAVTISGLSTRPKVNNSFQFDGDVNGTWYTVRKSSPLVGGISIVEFDQPPGLYPAPGAVVRFYQASFISASGQTLEYVGTGTNILTATPNLGGIPIQENEVVQTNGGIVNWTSTDQFGDFRIGEGLVIKEEAGIIEGPAFERGLFTVLTPYILALENN